MTRTRRDVTRDDLHAALRIGTAWKMRHRIPNRYTDAVASGAATGAWRAAENGWPISEPIFTTIVHRAIVDELRRCGGWTRRQADWERARRQASVLLGREPTDAEISVHATTRQAPNPPLTVVWLDDPDAPIQVAASGVEANPEDVAVERATARELAAAFECLPDRLKSIALARVGGATCRTIGEKFGVCESRISQLMHEVRDEVCKALAGDVVR